MFTSESLFINEQTDEINKTLEREIRLARNIQTKLLNGHQPKVENGEVIGTSIPANHIGGDYFDFLVLPNGKLRIIIADVMGKGIPAAMLMILTRGAFRSISDSSKGPGETLEAMNKSMYVDLRTLGSFVTVFCADWDPATNLVTYSSAGHNLPLRLTPKEGIVEFPKVKGVMIGGLQNQLYPENTIQLTNKEVVLFYTDGIIEAQNKDGDMFQMDKLCDVLLTCYEKEVKDIQDAIVHSIEMFTEGMPQKDDITMVLLKVYDNQ